MNFVRIIEKKKLGQPLTAEEITFFANGAADGSIPDYQLSAMLMAIRLNGMTREETARLTIAMTESGDQCDLSKLNGIPVDKHSTGGVGDTTTLVLAPLVASCGVPVAKMSGRGLGHTGGTLDKLESISGFNIHLSEEAFIHQVREIGVAVIGQSANLAPADKTLYALRDVTSTVDSLPLIASSIVSKKLASGAQGIVLDVKTGAGALMPTVERSIELAEIMVRIGNDAGRRMVALVTDMAEPLGSHVGNALEVKEAIDVLSGRTKGPLLDVSLSLGSCMLMLGEAAHSIDEGKQMLLSALEKGKGLDTLRKMIVMQGGDPACCDDVSALPQAPVKLPVIAGKAGYVHSMNTTELGMISQSLGAGRIHKTDEIDPRVGFVLLKRIGQKTEADEPIAIVHAKSNEDAERAANALRDNIFISDEKTPPSKLIHAYVTEQETIRF